MGLLVALTLVQMCVTKRGGHRRRCRKPKPKRREGRWMGRGEKSNNNLNKGEKEMFGSFMEQT